MLQKVIRLDIHQKFFPRMFASEKRFMETKHQIMMQDICNMTIRDTLKTNTAIKAPGTAPVFVSSKGISFEELFPPLLLEPPFLPFLSLFWFEKCVVEAVCDNS